MSIVFIGGGNMASALIGGLIAHGQAPEDIRVVEINPESARRLGDEWHVRTCQDAADAMTDVGTLVLAVKPQQLSGVVRALPPLAADVRVISIAAGIRTSDLSRWLDGHDNIVRAMPNMPALVCKGAAGLFALPGVPTEDRLHAQSLMRAVGSAIWVEREEDLDAVTAVSGSGPAYVFYFMEALLESARVLGLEESAARILVMDTILGAAELVKVRGESPATLRRQVTSPGGTTEAALALLEQAGVKSSVVQAIQAAAARARELGERLAQDAEVSR